MKRSQSSGLGAGEAVASKRGRRTNEQLQRAWDAGGDQTLSRCGECHKVYTTVNKHRCKIKRVEGSYVQKQTIKMGLHSVLHPTHRNLLLKALQPFLEQHTRILILGSRFLQLHLTRVLHSGAGVQLTQNLVKQCLLAVTTPSGQTPKLGEEDVAQTFTQCWPIDPSPPVRSGAVLV
jgi:hypothetical protein